ncbi:MAG: ABC transporter ATP-binding protein [Verrucomicrobiales bacterium]|nr:ABC transporter ATP-binding protein [Verrucomicrobiales bacterium]
MLPIPPKETREPVLRVRDLHKSYEGRVVLRGISFHVRAGERVALTGPSGSGKTTLLNCLGGVDRPDAGSIVLGDTPLEAMDDEALALFRRRRVGTVFQFFHLLPSLTAAENVELPLQLLGVPRADRSRRVRDLLDRVGVSHRSNAFPSELSGGERQRVAIARAMGHGPELLLADEPTGNLDSVNGDNILQLLTEWTGETGTALVLVTHSPEAASICHREIHLRDGQVESGSEPDVLGGASGVPKSHAVSRGPKLS